MPSSSAPCEEVRVHRYCEACGKYDPNGTMAIVQEHGRYQRVFAGILPSYVWDKEKQKFVKPKGKKANDPGRYLYRSRRDIDHSDSE